MQRNQLFQKYEVVNLLELNILEAAWMDKKKVLTENGHVGHWLFQRASDPHEPPMGPRSLKVVAGLQSLEPLFRSRIEWRSLRVVRKTAFSISTSCHK